MADVYGHRWVSSYGADPQAGAGATWANGLADLTADQLATGIEACMTSADPWPPTLPQFRAMCFDIPALATVRMRFMQQLRQRDPLVTEPFDRLVWQFIDGYRIRQVSSDQAERMVRDAYEIAREHVMAGGALPEPSVAVEHKPEPVRDRKPASPEEIERAKAAIRDLLRDDDTPPIPPPASPYSLGDVESELQQHYGSAQP